MRAATEAVADATRRGLKPTDDTARLAGVTGLMELYLTYQQEKSAAYAHLEELSLAHLPKVEAVLADLDRLDHEEPDAVPTEPLEEESIRQLVAEMRDALRPAAAAAIRFERAVDTYLDELSGTALAAPPPSTLPGTRSPRAAAERNRTTPGGGE